MAVAASDGTLIARFGEIDRPFFLRSSAKPFQAYVSQQAGAELTPLELAIACASHRGFPVHVALVRSILEIGGLGEDALGCPPDWPLGPTAAQLVLRSGAREPRRIWHNCSGKHAAFLRASAASGWPLDSYLDPAHPLQQRIVEFVSEVGRYAVEPVGVDGCGAPVLRTTTRAMATMFAHLANDPAMSEVFDAMHRYPALVAVNGGGDTEMAITSDAVAKGGAQGCVGVGLRGRPGLAVKSWDGLGHVAYSGAVSGLDQIGALTVTAREVLEPVIHPPVLGGDRPVGRLEPCFELEAA